MVFFRKTFGILEKTSTNFVNSIDIPTRNKRPMGHIAQLINSFNPIITFAQSNDLAIILREK